MTLLSREIRKDNLYTKSDIIELLSLQGESVKDLLKRALDVKLHFLDNTVRLRGLIEYSNICRKNCLYCGVRKSNTKADRYELSFEDVMNCTETAMKMNYASVVIQAGERTDKQFTDKITHLIRAIKEKSNNTIGITLSLGEQSYDVYKQWYEAGAHRYLLRIESSNKDLYYKIHPRDDLHSYENRLQCIYNLKEIGYQTGTGVMIGLPEQTAEDLADDILFFKNTDVDMVGMGPYIPHQDTPLWEKRYLVPDKKERMLMTLKMTAVLRLVMPEINIVSATANQTIDALGREKVITAGANVIMPNLSPEENRIKYSIYPDKACVNDKPEKCNSCLNIRMHTINHRIMYGEWGDSQAFLKRNKKKV